MTTFHEQMLAKLPAMKEKFAAKGADIQLPAASTTALGATFLGMGEGEKAWIEVEIPFNKAFSNVFYAYQGGFLCAAFDEAYGPLAFLVAGMPCFTIEMNTHFMRPFTQKDEAMRVRAELVNKTRTLVNLSGEIRTREGKLIATSTTVLSIAQERHLLKNDA